MAKRPGTSLLIVVMLAAGIGASTTVFSVVDTFLLRPLPFPGADRLVEVESTRGDTEVGVSYPDYLDWRQRSRGFKDLAFFHSNVLANLTVNGVTEPAEATLATWNLFPLLGVAPRLGRWPIAADDRPGAPCVVVMSESLWTRRFAADARILGKKVLLEGGVCEVIGVMPAAFRFPSQTEIWSSIGPLADSDDRLVRYDAVIGRLRPGIGIVRAAKDMARVAKGLAGEFPLTNEGVGARVVPLRDVVVGDVRQPLLVVFGACGFLLLMACANAANLLLARASGREREMAIRIALGADRGRLVRQLTAEHLIFAACGGGFGLLVAYLGVAAVRRAIPLALPSWIDLVLDWRAVAYTTAISVLVGLLFGLVPLLQVARADQTAPLKEGQAAGAGRSRRRLRSSLVVFEIALALVLLIGADFMVLSFLHLRRLDPGFESAGVLVADVNLAFHAGEVSATGRFSQLVQAAVTRVGQLPGVDAAAAVVNLPLTGQNVLDRFEVTLFGQSAGAQKQNPVINLRRASPDYFKVLRIGVLQGRVFGPADVVGQPRVAVLGEATAQRLWPHQASLGRRFKLGPPASDAPWVTVVGVVRDVHQESLLGGPGCDLFVPIFQVPGKIFTIVAKAKGPRSGLPRALRSTLMATSPEIGVSRSTTLDEVVASSLWVQRLWGCLFGCFSLLSLLLAAGGIYGVVASSVHERTREIGVRIALGARRESVLVLLLGHGLKLGLVGTALGLALALDLTATVSSLVFAVDAEDPRVLLELCLFLLGVVVLASWLASRRARRVDPRVALQAD